MADNSVNTSTSFSSVQSQSTSRRVSPRKRDATDIPGGSGSSSKVPRGPSSDTTAPQERGPTIKTLRVVAVKLQAHLKREDISNLGYVMQFPETFDQSLHKHSNPVRFFIEEAEKLGKISDENFDQLIEVLNTLKLQAASKVVEECKSFDNHGDNIVPKEKQEKVNPPLSKQEKASKTAKFHWKMFQDWSKDNKVNDPKKASCAKISNYLKHLYHNKGLKVSSIRGHLKNIRSFHDGFDDDSKLKVTLKYLALTEKASRPKSGNNA